MNRRNFLQSGTLAIAAVTGLPKGIQAMGNRYLTNTYRTKKDETKKEQWLYELVIDQQAVDNFSSAKDSDKIFTIKGAFFENGDFTKPAKQVECRYTIQSSVKKETAWVVESKFLDKISADDKFGKGFPKNPKLKYWSYAEVSILGKKDALVDSLFYVDASSSGSGDCFITTACVHARALPDDCTELQTLRSLRELHMRTNDEGQALIDGYKKVGPQIVQAINRLDNKKEIYAYMYDQMIVPAVQLVKAGQYAEAINYYKAFVKGLVRIYL